MRHIWVSIGTCSAICNHVLNWVRTGGEQSWLHPILLHQIHSYISWDASNMMHYYDASCYTMHHFIIFLTCIESSCNYKPFICVVEEAVEAYKGEAQVFNVTYLGKYGELHNILSGSLIVKENNYIMRSMYLYRTTLFRLFNRVKLTPAKHLYYFVISQAKIFET